MAPWSILANGAVSRIAGADRYESVVDADETESVSSSMATSVAFRFCFLCGRRFVGRIVSRRFSIQTFAVAAAGMFACGGDSSSSPMLSVSRYCHLTRLVVGILLRLAPWSGRFRFRIPVSALLCPFGGSVWDGRVGFLVVLLLVPAGGDRIAWARMLGAGSYVPRGLVLSGRHRIASALMLGASSCVP